MRLTQQFECALAQESMEECKDEWDVCGPFVCLPFRKLKSETERQNIIITMVQTGQVHRVQNCGVTKGLLRKHFFKDLVWGSISSVGLWKMGTFWTGIFRWNNFLARRRGGRTLTEGEVVSGGSAVCAMGSRGKLGLCYGRCKVGH